MSRHRYVIGDLQGCYASFVKLLEVIDFDENLDKIYLCGDLVARGENSLDTLRLAKALADKGALETVLGNHDVTLIATWLGVLPIKPKDKTAPIFESADCDELLNWLRVQPFLLDIELPNGQGVVVHAGIPPHWSTKNARAYAGELSAVFAGDLANLEEILPKLYNKKSEPWHKKLKGTKRLKAITDYFTRMRLCDKDGTLEFDFKGELGDVMPKGFLPWFDWQTVRDERIFFGHWAGLMAKIDTPLVRALDAGCVWGGQLLAYRLDDGQTFAVDLVKVS